MNFLATLTKGYAGYAFAVNETHYLQDLYEEKDESVHKDKAVINYSKAMEYGLRYLSKEGLTYQMLQKSVSDKNGVVGLLEDNIDDDTRDLEVVLFTAQSLASMINLQKDKMTLVSQLPIAKECLIGFVQKSLIFTMVLAIFSLLLMRPDVLRCWEKSC